MRASPCLDLSVLARPGFGFVKAGRRRNTFLEKRPVGSVARVRDTAVAAPRSRIKKEQAGFATSPSSSSLLLRQPLRGSQTSRIQNSQCCSRYRMRSAALARLCRVLSRGLRRFFGLEVSSSPLAGPRPSHFSVSSKFQKNAFTKRTVQDKPWLHHTELTGFSWLRIMFASSV
jgi:hypothetical protein